MLQTGHSDARAVKLFVDGDRVRGLKESPRAVFQFARAQAYAGKMNTAMSAWTEALAAAWTLHRDVMKRAGHRTEVESLANVIAERMSTTLLKDRAASAHAARERAISSFIQEPDRPIRVAFLTNGLCDGSESAELLLALSQLDDACVLCGVFTSESRVKRHRLVPALCKGRKESEAVGSAVINRLGMMGVDVRLAMPGEKPAMETIELVTAINDIQADVLLIDAPMSDAIAMTAATLCDVPYKISLCRNSPIMSSAIHRTIDLSDQNISGVWTDRRVSCVTQGVGPRHAMPLDRSRLGLSGESVLMVTTCGPAGQGMSTGFAGTIRSILIDNPQAAVSVLCDASAVGKIRETFATVSRNIDIKKDEGLRRIYLCTDLKQHDSIMRGADVYLAGFPSPEPTGVLAAMAMSVPICAMTSRQCESGRVLADIVGKDRQIDSSADYIAYASKLARDPTLRWKEVSLLRSRVSKFASVESTAQEIFDLIAREWKTHLNRMIASSRRVSPRMRLAAVA